MFFELLNTAFQFWITSQWYVALVMSLGLNCFVYLGTALTISLITSKLDSTRQIGQYLDKRKLKKNQTKIEIFYGLTTCFIFSFTSLLARILFENVWPTSILNFVLQLIIFSIFYETYSYFIHRLLHTPLLRFAHSIHHSSVRVTPWSAYSVHPIEAFFIGTSAALFMCFFPMSLSLILALHIIGMIFTMFIHSNFVLNDSIFLSKVFNRYTSGHSLHHQKGIVNYGFVNSFWDRVFKTKYKAI